VDNFSELTGRCICAVSSKDFDALNDSSKSVEQNVLQYIEKNLKSANGCLYLFGTYELSKIIDFIDKCLVDNKPICRVLTKFIEKYSQAKKQYSYRTEVIHMIEFLDKINRKDLYESKYTKVIKEEEYNKDLKELIDIYPMFSYRGYQESNSNLIFNKLSELALIKERESDTDI